MSMSDYNPKEKMRWIDLPSCLWSCVLQFCRPKFLLSTSRVCHFFCDLTQDPNSYYSLNLSEFEGHSKPTKTPSLPCLRGIKVLTEICEDHTHILKHCARLEELTLRGSSFPEQERGAIWTADSLPNPCRLRSLSYEEMKVTSSMLEGFQELRKLKCHVLDVGTVHTISALKHLSSLSVVSDILETDLPAALLRAGAAGAFATTLTQLVLTATGFPARGWCSDLGALQALTQLTCHHLFVVPGEKTCLNAQSLPGSLTDLRLRDVHLVNGAHLSTAVTPCLRLLVLEDCVCVSGPTCNGTHHQMDLDCIPLSLTSLSFNAAFIGEEEKGDAAAPLLALLGRLPDLIALHLEPSSCTIWGVGDDRTPVSLVTEHHLPACLRNTEQLFEQLAPLVRGQLTELDWMWEEVLTPRAVSLLLSMTRLKEIQLHGCKLQELSSIFARSTSPTVVASASAASPRPWAVTELDLGNSSIRDEGLQWLSEACPSLQSLHLQFCPALTDKGVAFISKCRNVTHLDLSHDQQIVGRSLGQLANAPRLRCLRLFGCLCLLTSSVAQLVQAAPELRELDIGDCTALDTKTVLGDIVPQFGHLKRLYVNKLQPLDHEATDYVLAGLGSGPIRRTLKELNVGQTLAGLHGRDTKRRRATLFSRMPRLWEVCYGYLRANGTLQSTLCYREWADELGTENKEETT